MYVQPLERHVHTHRHATEVDLNCDEAQCLAPLSATNFKLAARDGTEHANVIASQHHVEMA